VHHWVQSKRIKKAPYSFLGNRQWGQGNQKKPKEPINPVNEAKEDNDAMGAKEANLRKPQETLNYN
jgi:hypothetical protein